MIPKEKMPDFANIICIQVIYKTKKNDDGSLKLKARIAPHGSEDSRIYMLTTDCTIRPRTGLRIDEFRTSLFGWKLYTANTK